MSRYMIESVPEKCKACRRCEIACIAAHHGLTFKEALKKRDELVARVHVVKSGSVKSPISCRQCENAPCARICPTGALQQDDGIVTMNAQICSGWNPSAFSPPRRKRWPKRVCAPWPCAATCARTG